MLWIPPSYLEIYVFSYKSKRAEQYVTWITFSLKLVGIQHRTSDQYLTSGQVWNAQPEVQGRKPFKKFGPKTLTKTDAVGTVIALPVLSHRSALFVFELRFLRPCQPIGVMSSTVSLPNNTFSWAGSVLWVVNQYCAYSFARNWQLPFLNQWKEENDRRKYFHDQSPWKNVADPVRGSNPQPPDHLTHIQLSHWDQPYRWAKKVSRIFS